MEITFLGTGGADWPDEPSKGFFRHHASILVNGKILVDPGPGIYEYANSLPGVDLSGLSAIFLTHTHPDHWSKETLESLVSKAKGPITLYFHAGARPNLCIGPTKKLILKPLRRGQTVAVEKTSWLNLEANHICDHGERGSHYIVSEEDKTFFYGCDGGWFTTKTWDVMRTKQFDCVILDGTVGENSADYRLAGHNTLAMNRLLLGAMQEHKLLKPGAKVFLSHFGKNTYGPSPENAGKIVRASGFLEARDADVVRF